MDLMCLNDAFECVGYLPYLHLMWTRRYYDCGEFSAQLRAEDYDPEVRYLYTPDRPEIGVVEKLHTESDITGRYVQISGRFLESMLDRDVIWPKFKKTGQPSKLAHALVEGRADSIPSLSVSAYSLDASDEEETDCDYCGDQLDEVTWALLKLSGKSQRLVYDFDAGRIRYSVWQGLDRTQSQNVNAYALFSDLSGNTERITLDEDESGYRNMALIALSDKETITVDQRKAGEASRWIFVDAIDGSPSGGQTEAQYRSALRLKAMQELARWPKVISIEAATIQSGLLYLRDYDLGDLCDVVSNEYGKSYESRIVEIREVFKEGQHEVEIVFGDKIPTVYERMRNL